MPYYYLFWMVPLMIAVSGIAYGVRKIRHFPGRFLARTI